MNGLKKLLANKNTVTVIGLIAVIAVLYFAYNFRVNQATNPVTVPYAIKNIGPSTQITADMVGTIKVSPSMVSDGVIRKAADVVDNYSNIDTVIPKGSLFFTRTVVTKENLPAGDILDYEQGYVLYNMAVDMNSTYGNSVVPGNYIDLYLKAIFDNGSLVYGKFIESIEVLDVRDSQGKHVFDGGESSGTPSVLLFAVPDDMHLLLNKARLINTNSIEIYPVPRNASYSENPGETVVKSDFLKNFILAKSAIIPED